MKTIELSEQDKNDLRQAVNDLIKLHDTGKADEDYLTYIGMFCLSLAERARATPRRPKGSLPFKM
jgi:CRISPR/Cas system-associated endonuclease Cas3-HD